MARNKIVYFEDIKINTHTKSKYVLNKDIYINKLYNNLYLKDIICDINGVVYGVCKCNRCREDNVVTIFSNLVTYRTQNCSNCSRKRGTFNNSKYDDKSYIGKEYGYLKVLDIVRYKDKNSVYWLLTCKLCNNTKIMKASSVVNGTTKSCGCLLNKRNNKYSNKEWEGKEVNGTSVIKLGNKKYSGQTWICKCRYCNKEFEALARKIVSGHTNSCGCTKESIGTTEIKNYLIENSINFIQEWTSDKLISQYGNQLRIDFAILNNDNKVIAFIEYDGLQHIDPYSSFGATFEDKYNNFLDTTDSDNRKNTFALNNNIPLKRIQYSRHKNQILDELKKFIEYLSIKIEYHSDIL